MEKISQNKQIKACVVSALLTADKNQMSQENRLAEAVGLAEAIFLDVVYQESVRLKVVKPATFFSKGFLEKIQTIIKEKEISLMIVDSFLTPVQQNHLERELQIKVIDRTALILEIFGQRANTSEGKLQVELAHLTYQRSRLVRSWTHLERQRGGAGFLGGPGEKQIELDRRLIDQRIVKIKKELEKVKKTRELQRHNRQSVPYPVAALVGYTNAGKSSLFNRLSGSEVLAQDMLFATLDPCLRKVVLPSKRAVIVSDTVGFISDLPHELVMAFRSTLEEVLQADILIHVRDISNPDSDLQRKEVLAVLESLGLDCVEKKENYIEVLNKSDLLSETEQKNLDQKLVHGPKNIISVSALKGKGIDTLLSEIDEVLAGHYRKIWVEVSSNNGKLRNWIYENAEVLKVEDKDEQTHCFEIRIDSVSFKRLKGIMESEES